MIDRPPRWRHLALALVLFAIEVAIALWVHDGLVRPLLGDVLAVVLVWAVLCGLTRLGPRSAALAAFLIACLIEAGQAAHVLRLLGLEHVRVARVVLGTQADPRDLIAYALGALAALALNPLLMRRDLPKPCFGR